MHLHKEGEDTMNKEWEVSGVRYSSGVKENGVTSLGDQVMIDLELSGWRRSIATR